MARKRFVAIVSTSRADYGIYRPVIAELQERKELTVELLVTGAHLSREHGLTVSEVERDGFTIGARIPILGSGDRPLDVAEAIGRAVKGFARVYARRRPDLLLVLGDRYEMFAAALASVPFVIPLAHLHGGEMTLGAYDDAMRHALTKLSHIHFVSTKVYRDRVIQMGESPRRVIVSGAPGLDAIRKTMPIERQELGRTLGISLERAPLLVTYHPETLSGRSPSADLRKVLNALHSFGGPIVITGANADAGGREIRDMALSFAKAKPNRGYFANLGSKRYLSLMRIAAAVVGNSSSGIIEAASFKCPVVNIGNRQSGRLRPPNVIDCACRTSVIELALHKALSPAFRRRLKSLRNPYGNGYAAKRIADVLANVKLDADLVRKVFRDQLR